MINAINFKFIYNKNYFKSDIKIWFEKQSDKSIDIKSERDKRLVIGDNVVLVLVYHICTY